jgi:hypothetical protein
LQEEVVRDIATFDWSGCSFMELLTADWVVHHLDNIPVSIVSPNAEPFLLPPEPGPKTYGGEDSWDPAAI